MHYSSNRTREQRSKVDLLSDRERKQDALELLLQEEHGVPLKEDFLVVIEIVRGRVTLRNEGLAFEKGSGNDGGRPSVRDY